MNLRSKWCLYGLLSWAAMAGIASAQPPGSVQLGVPSAEQLPPPITSMDEAGQVSLGDGMGYTSINRQFRPRFNVDTRGGGLYGYDPGYTNIGMFVPFAIEEDTAILFVDGRGMITHDGGGGANLGAGWRWWMEDIDRIVGVSTWFDYDNGQRAAYSQIGLSFESLGRYVDYRINGYVPVGARAQILSSTVDTTTDAVFQGNSLVFRRTNVAEQTYTGFDAELGGPLPVIGRYGVNGYVGGYHFMGNGVAGGSFTGVSGRFMAQINEDVSFGVQATDDHVFGFNTQFQVFVTLPEGMPSRWLRNPRVQDRLTQSVFRSGRVMAHTDTYSTFDLAINPKDGLPYFVTHIDPNLGSPGTGTFENPFNSIAVYNGQSVFLQQKSDIIYVRPRADGTNTNLDTAPTFTVYEGQRLLSTSVPHTFMSNNFPGLVHNLPGFVPDLLPQLFNSAGGDVITLADGAECLEVSGFDITGSAGGSGISGANNGFININRNTIHDGFNGINLVNLLDSTHGPSIISTNILRDNVNDGFHLLNIGGPSVTTLRLLNNTAFGNGDDGFDIAADVGSTIGGLIASNSTSPVNGGVSNGDTGLTLSSNGGVLAFNDPLALPAPQQISNNIFSDNSGDGVFVDVTGGGNADLLFLANTIGNNSAGIHVPASDGSLINLVIGGPDDVLDRNNIAGNGGPGILFDLSNTANGVTARIENNLITSNLDGIQINVTDTAVFGPAVGANVTEIFDNEITGNTRDGIRLTRSDSANLNLGTPAAPPIHDNNISGNAQNGLALLVTDDNSVPVVLSTEDNIFDTNGLDGLTIIAGVTGGAVDNPDVFFDSNRDQFTANGRHGLNIISNDQANIFTNLVNVTANGNAQSGMNSISNDSLVPGTGSGQVINIYSTIDPLFIGTSSFSNNGGDGMLNTANNNSTMIVNVNPNNENQILFEGNGSAGWRLNRFDTSLILASAQNATFSNNPGDGIGFDYSGSPPTDPNQPPSPIGVNASSPPYVDLPFLPNQLILNNIIAEGNGGNGLHTVGTADATLLSNITLSSFVNNTQNGILINTELGSSFGNRPPPSSPPSIFDALTIVGNGGDGIHIDQNRFLATGSNVYLEINTNSGNTDISNNSSDGIHVESDGNETEILIHSTLGNELTINSNAANGLRWDVTSNGAGVGHTITIDDVTIDANGGDAVQFNVPSGSGNLVVNNSRLLNSGDDGINVNVTALDDPTGLSLGGFGILNAANNVIAFNNNHGVNVQLQGDDDERFFSPNVQVTLDQGNQIISNGLNGVNVELRGLSEPRTFIFNAFVIDGNRIALNGQRAVFNQAHGIFFLEDAGTIQRVGSNGSINSHRLEQIQTPRPTNPDFSYDAFIPLFAPLIPDYNTGDLANTAFFLSRYMNLHTNLNASLEVTNNVIEFNGPDPTAPGEGVFLRVSTNAYLSADVSGNTFTGNGSSDFRTESFVTGGNPPQSVARGAPAPDDVYLDDTAQLDLRLANNTGQSIQPRYVFGNQNLGAQYLNPDFRKTNNFIPRGVELFAVDNTATGLSTNVFTNLAGPQPTLFFNAGYHLNNVTPWSLNNTGADGFPRTYGGFSTIGAGNSPDDPFQP